MGNIFPRNLLKRTYLQKNWTCCLVAGTYEEVTIQCRQKHYKCHSKCHLKNDNNTIEGNPVDCNTVLLEMPNFNSIPLVNSQSKIILQKQLMETSLSTQHVESSTFKARSEEIPDQITTIGERRLNPSNLTPTEVCIATTQLQTSNYYNIAQIT